MAPGTTVPSRWWFRLGFPAGYVSDVLEVLEVLVELGHGGDPRLEHATAWLLAQRDKKGRWVNRCAYNGRTWSDVERQGQPSRWVTLRALRALRGLPAVPDGASWTG